MGAIIWWIIMLVATFDGDGNNFWFKAVLWGGIGLFILCCISAHSFSKKEWKAHCNWVDYWAEGGSKRFR